MARREDFRIELAEPSVRMCDLCAEMCEGPRIATYVGVSSQSDLCMLCVEDVIRLMTPVVEAKKRTRVLVDASAVTA